MISGFSCHVEFGLLSGGIATGTYTWEMDGPKATELAETFVVYKLGAIAVARGTEGAAEGSTGSGRYDYVMATGDWAPLAGKSETWVERIASPWEFSFQSTLQ